MALLVASADDALRDELLLPLAREGVPARGVATWEALCQGLCDPGTRLALVDPALPGLDPSLARALAASLAHKPRIKTVGGPRGVLERVPHTPRALTRVARSLLGPGGLTPEDRRDLSGFGLGDDPLPRMVDAVSSGLPILLLGERGTGKERLARILHRLSVAATPGPRPPALVALPVGTRWERAPGPGTLYLEAAHRRDPAEVRALVRDALALRWRVIAGTRAAEAPLGVEWHLLPLPPLRERPNDLARLAAAWVDQHAARRGLTRRRLDRSLLAAMHAWRWPGNQRELEDFVAAAVATLPGPTLRARDLTPELAARLRPPVDATTQHVGGFEELAEERLRAVVAAYTPGGGPTLHALVIGATERALLSLALARTGGNRKAAAALLGLARNTLQAKIEALRISASRE